MQGQWWIPEGSAMHLLFSERFRREGTWSWKTFLPPLHSSSMYFLTWKFAQRKDLEPKCPRYLTCRKAHIMSAVMTAKEPSIAKPSAITEEKNWLIVCMHVCVLNHVCLLMTPWTVAHQAPLSIGFPRQEYWSGLPRPPSGDLSNPGIEPEFLMARALTGRFFTTSAAWEAQLNYHKANFSTSRLYTPPNSQSTTHLFYWFCCYKITSLSNYIVKNIWLIKINS